MVQYAAVSPRIPDAIAATIKLTHYRSGVLLDHNVVAQREITTGPFARRLGRKERIKYFLPHLGRNAAAVVANPDFDVVAKVLRCSSKGGLVAIKFHLRVALGCRIEAVRNYIEKDPRHLLRKQIDLADGGIKRPLQLDFKFLIFGPGTVIGNV
jgi:hypothetical protein